MKFSDLKMLRLVNFYRWTGGLPLLLLFAGYLLFGLANIYFFSMAIKQVPTAMAFAIWTAITLILLKLSEISFFGQRFSWQEVFFMLVIMVGILGLKMCSSQPGQP
ncbi:multidrug efflux SMR transporter [Mucilaginibacter sp. L3T2-6]|uniref:multidrug efflux SMR transporter n=1 Tax=Mucilaginibacter sp. L3T2-6 TaxID=3062491 RepID=UPI0034A0CC1F